jgi:hypothetical protein
MTKTTAQNGTVKREVQHSVQDANTYGSVRFSPEPHRASVVCGQESAIANEFDTRHEPVMSRQGRMYAVISG